MGVDFGPYLTRVVQIVKQNWYTLMPPSVYPPILKQGKLSIEFVILKDGKTTGMVVHTSSGDVALDRAAWRASRLPPRFRRCRRNFRANPRVAVLLFLQHHSRRGFHEVSSRNRRWISRRGIIGSMRIQIKL
jgi:TonB family protein